MKITYEKQNSLPVLIESHPQLFEGKENKIF